jgi:hypothetical protein
MVRLGRQVNARVTFVSRDGTVVGYVYAGIEPQSWKELRDAAGFIHDVVVDQIVVVEIVVVDVRLVVELVVTHPGLPSACASAYPGAGAKQR